MTRWQAVMTDNSAFCPQHPGIATIGRLRIRPGIPNRSAVGEWRRLVAHLVWDQGVAGSNPVSPTTRR